METQTPPSMLEIPKSESYQRHQRQRFWQILLPVAIGSLLILAILALVIRTAIGTDAGGPVSQWSDASLIWLSLPALLFALVMALILIGMIYMIGRLLKILPGYTYTGQYYVRLAADFIAEIADKLVVPFIAVRGVSASVQAFFAALSGRRNE
jgi:hypothetical protein